LTRLWLQLAEETLRLAHGFKPPSQGSWEHAHVLAGLYSVLKGPGRMTADAANRVRLGYQAALAARILSDYSPRGEIERESLASARGTAIGLIRLSRLKEGNL